MKQLQTAAIFWKFSKLQYNKLQLLFIFSFTPAHQMRNFL